ncbi:MAG: ABC transporter ATP-binding protein [Gammaproteobacteria bacterium]|nr:ABC transporter ATP-binding protein [Gammaproteobacteria bacterium]NND53712.1 ABC transporter ATP-binding protein [Gammaproteobacteria bacterium]
MTKAHLQTTGLDIRVAGRTLVHQLELEISGGSFVCVLGTNGAGKTLTLHTLAGLRDAPGEIYLNGDNVADLSRLNIARRLGLLLQIHEDAFPVSVMDSTLLGRFPHLGLMQWPGRDDREAVRDALRRCDLSGFEDRLLATLSGGERERVALATLMAQDPDIWLLDEPMNHLDPHHQIAVLEELAAVAAAGRLVISTVHNPALAMRYADHALLLYGDGNWEYGPTGDMLEPERLERMYRTPFNYYTAENDARTVLLPS